MTAGRANEPDPRALAWKLPATLPLAGWALLLPFLSSYGLRFPFCSKSKLGKRKKNLAVSHLGRGRVESKRPPCDSSSPQNRSETPGTPVCGLLTRGGQA